MFWMKNVFCVMLLLPLLFQSSFSLSLFKHLFSHLSTGAMKSGAGSTAMKTGAGSTPKTCVGDYLITVSLAVDKKSTIVESIFFDATELVDCAVIEGDLTIQGAAVAQNSMRTTSGYPPLNKILGIVQEVTGNVKIMDTPDLIAIVQSLTQLKTIGDQLFIDGNGSLGKIIFLALPSLSTIGGNLNISSTKGLMSMNNAFPNVLKIGRDLVILGNFDLVSIAGSFSLLETIGGILRVRVNSEQNFDSKSATFPSLLSIGGGKAKDEFKPKQSKLRANGDTFPKLLSIAEDEDVNKFFARWY